MTEEEAVAALRARIDAVDDTILELLAGRAALVRELWARKRAAGTGVKDLVREEAVFLRLREAAAARGLDAAAVEAVFRTIVGRELGGR